MKYITHDNPASRPRPPRWSRRPRPTRLSVPTCAAFTLTELLVVISILTFLAVLTLASVRGISQGARLSSSSNTVSAVLDNARALAMENNEIVVVAFRARPETDNRQVIEAITGRFSGESYIIPAIFGGIGDRFAPIADIRVRTLAEGISVAAPSFAAGEDRFGGDGIFPWETPSNFAAIRRGEEAGAIIAVMFGPDGATLTDNPRTDSIRMYLDFNDDGLQQQNGNGYDNINNWPAQDYCDLAAGTQFYCQAQVDDEPYLTIAPYLAVFDEKQARSDLDVTLWTDGIERAKALSQFIADTANRLHFNRYTGVVMK